MKIRDCSVADFIGAAAQWTRFLTVDLGFSDSSKAEVVLGASAGNVMCSGFDDWQNSIEYGKKVGQIGYMSEHFSLDAEWEEVQSIVWTRLQKKMRRDERELRFGVQQLSGMIENFSVETQIGKMIHERLVKVRDDMSSNLLTYQLGEGEIK